MAIFALVVFLSLVILTIVKVQSSNQISHEYKIYSQKAVKGKIAVLAIEADMNYISRCTRDIMLGNAYNKNVDKIKKRIESINKSYKNLKESTRGTSNETKKLELVDNAHKSTIAFVNDGYKKMVSLDSTKQTPEILANMYKNTKKMLHHSNI